jgi:hypothetical protein
LHLALPCRNNQRFQRDGEKRFSVRWNGDDDVVPVPMMVKTAMGMATKNLAVSGGESLTGARSAPTVIKPAYQAGRKRQSSRGDPRFFS